MKIKFDVRIGDRTIQIEDECASTAEAWQKLAFWDSLPTEGPGGERDLKFSYRTPQDYEYYALECPSIGKEFKMGQHKDNKASLFPKDWDEIRHGQEYQEEQEAPPQRRQQAAPSRSQSAPSQSTNSRQPNQTRNLQNAGTPTEFWKLASQMKVAKATAEDIRDQFTDGTQTNWAAAIAELRKAA